MTAEYLKANEVKEIIVLCTHGEFNKYRVPKLLPRLTEAGFSVHHHAIIDGCVAPVDELQHILDKIRSSLSQNKKTIVW